MWKSTLISVLICFVGSDLAKGSFTGPDLLREAEKLLPYLRDVRRSAIMDFFYASYSFLLWMLSKGTYGIPSALLT